MMVPIGKKRVDSETSEVLFCEGNVLVVGKGPERFGVLNTILAGLNSCGEECCFYGIDYSGQLDCWGDSFARVASDGDSAVEIAEDLLEESKQRSRFMVTRALSSFDEGDMPLVVLVVSELADVAGDEQAMSLLKRIVAQAAPRGILTVACLGRELNNVTLPASMRSNFSDVIVCRVDSFGEVEACVGSWDCECVAAHLIPRELPDVVYWCARDLRRRPVLLNAFLTGVDEAARISSAAARV